MDDVKQEQQKPETEQGTTLAIDSSIAADPPALDIDQEKSESKPAPGAFMTPEKLMTVLNKMVNSEQVTREQARQMRRQFGITNNYFTKSKTTREQKNAKKKVADASRRANRNNNSAKGQKRSSGRGD